MQTIKGYLKKLLLVYIVSISMVIVYFIIKTLMPHDKDIILKSFTKEPVNQEVPHKEKIVEINNSREFLLLPVK